MKKRVGRERSGIQNFFVPAQQRSARVQLLIALDAAPCGRGIQLGLTPVDDDEKLVADRFSVVITLWRESSTVVRGTITHGSGGVAHFQGGEALIAMSRALGLRLEPAT
jgi:hypothetical protein